MRLRALPELTPLDERGSRITKFDCIKTHQVMYDDALLTTSGPHGSIEKS